MGKGAITSERRDARIYTSRKVSSSFSIAAAPVHAPLLYLGSFDQLSRLVLSHESLDEIQRGGQTLAKPARDRSSLCA